MAPVANSPAEAEGGVEFPKAAHRIVPLFDATVILFQSIVQIGTATVNDIIPYRLTDGPWIGIMAVRRHPVCPTERASVTHLLSRQHSVGRSFCSPSYPEGMTLDSAPAGHQRSWRASRLKLKSDATTWMSSGRGCAMSGGGM
jgi:hypothetical protein